jgi:hypothetical protein
MSIRHFWKEYNFNFLHLRYFGFNSGIVEFASRYFGFNGGIVEFASRYFGFNGGIVELALTLGL